MDPAWSGRGVDLVPSCVGHVCRPPINLIHYCKVLLDYSNWIVIVVHSLLIIMLLLKLLYLILSLIIFCFIMKNSTPPWPGLGGGTPPSSKSIPAINIALTKLSPGSNCSCNRDAISACLTGLKTLHVISP